MAKSSQGDMLFTAILGLCDGLLYEASVKLESDKPTKKNRGFFYTPGGRQSQTFRKNAGGLRSFWGDGWEWSQDSIFLLRALQFDNQVEIMGV